MKQTVKRLQDAERKAQFLFDQIDERGMIVAGKSEREINKEVFQLAEELFGIKKYWHKRIVRSGKNTLLPYKENPPDLILQSDDILFFDFGPVFEDWEADVGKTYVLGENQLKWRLKRDIEHAWKEGKDYYQRNKETITGAEFYTFTLALAANYGWSYGNEHCGHLIGNFPHEKLCGEEVQNYIHPDNHQLMSEKDRNGNERFWIYEIHFTDEQKEIGGFFEQLVS